MKRAINSVIVLSVLWSAMLMPSLLSADVDEAPSDPRWVRAEKAYRTGHLEDGHLLLKQLVNDHPGDVDLAVSCLEKILREAGRWDSGDSWVRFATKRLTALERLQALSPNTRLARDAYDIELELRQQEGRQLEVVEDLERLAEKNSGTLLWRVLRARAHKRMDSAESLALYEELKNESDLDHPDAETRERWHWFSGQLESDSAEFPKPIIVLPAGNSPLLFADPDDPDGRWRKVLDEPPANIPREIDRLTGEAMAENQVVPWTDMTGVLDPVRALDMHLQSKPNEGLAALRRLQTANYSYEQISKMPTESKVLSLYRRYSWALPAQQRLLKQANSYLWAGRLESAWRCFQDLLTHSADATLVDAARVGNWIVLAQLGRFHELDEIFKKIPADRTFQWMGMDTPAAEIRAKLVVGHSLKNSPENRASESALQSLRKHVIYLPPVSPWPTDKPAAGSTVDLSVDGEQLLVSARNLIGSYDARAPGAPLWTQVQRHPIEERHRTGYHPGYFRPVVAASGDVLYSRWGFGSLPSAIAAYDRATGQPQWSSEPLTTNGKSKRRRQFSIPLGDPVLVDGLLFYLQWSTQHDVNHNRGRELALVCHDPNLRAPLWESVIIESGNASDILGSFERAQAQSAIYGNRVTVHRGAVYSSSNSGLIARSDVRDGRTDWIHYYRRNRHDAGSQNLGCAPIVAGNVLICMPRDTARVFALDLKTGRRVWDNPFVAGVECLGVVDDVAVVRSLSAVVGLDIFSGKARWYRPLAEPVIGRAQLTGNSIYYALGKHLCKLDARTGQSFESLDWNLENERPLGFAVTKENVYVVSDKPADDPIHRVAQPLNPDAAAHSGPPSLPLQLNWKLQRSDATIVLPPEGSPLAGTAYVLSGGILECIELSSQGAIRWQRFVSAYDATLHLAGDKLVMVERRSNAGATNRAIAFNASDGRVAWDKRDTIPHQLGQTMQCGPHQLFHDAKERMVVIDLKTGDQVWQRNLGQGQIMVPHWDGTRLHVFHTTLRRGAHHVEIAAESGETLVEHGVEIKTVEGVATNGKPIGDGYFEVAFAPKSARYFRLVTLSEVNGRGWASAAEVHVLGADGKRVSRDAWHVTADSSETKATRYDPTPDKLFDGDPTSWWHSQWLNGIPEHPHEIVIDLGSIQSVRALHYLPAVIVNNNGMIRDYELYVSNDGKQWGEPVARGILVNRVRVNRAVFAAEGALFFESHGYRQRKNAVFRYELGNQPGVLIEDDARIVEVAGQYVLLAVRQNNKEFLSVLNASDPSYRFDLDEKIIPRGQSGEIYIEGDRLMTVERKIVVANLKTKSIIVEPSEDKNPQNQHGIVVRTSPDTLFKFVNRGQRGQEVTKIDLRTGELTTGILESQTEPLQVRLQQAPRAPRTRRLFMMGDVLLFYDGSTITAWSGS